VAVYEAVTSRRSVRRFTDQPVPREVLERVLSAAAWAPTVAEIVSPLAELILYCGMSIGHEHGTVPYIRTWQALESSAPLIPLPLFLPSAPSRGSSRPPAPSGLWEEAGAPAQVRRPYLCTSPRSDASCARPRRKARA
jgi:nitroreductase